jgi:hypothetical protein
MQSEALKNSLRVILSFPWEELLLLVLVLVLALLRLLKRLGITALVARKLAEELSILNEAGKRTEQEGQSKNGKSLTSEGKDVPEST